MDLFNNIKSEAELSKEPEQETKPAESLTEKEEVETTNVSEDAKTQEGEDFHKHSRFKELVEEKNDWKGKAEEYETKMSALQAELEEVRGKVASVTDQNKSDLPKFETLEDLQTYLAELPRKMKEEVVKEIQVASEAEKTKVQEADDYLQGELDSIIAKDKDLDKDEFLKFALEYDIVDIKKAYGLYSQINHAKDEGTKKGEEIGLRKASSGLKSSQANSSESKPSYRRGQTLDEIIAEAKAGIKGI